MKLQGSLPPARAVIGYMVLPRLLPRLSELGFRFSFVAYLMAMIYASARLLPAGHPYLNPSLMGTYSVRQVFFEAARHLRWRLANLDQILIFFLLLSAFLLLWVQVALMLLFFVTSVAHAGGVVVPKFTSMFYTPDPTNDIAMMFLDRVFGVPNFFGSCISTAAVCEATGGGVSVAEPAVYPEPYQLAMQSLFAFYSFAMMTVGAIILLYFFFVVVVESAQTGVPFGARFASVYAPIRLSLAVLLLMPLGYGYNTAQYLTLTMAKIGSAVGTNAWNIFNREILVTPGNSLFNFSNSTNPSEELLVRPKPPVIDPLIKFFHLANTCRAAYKIKDGVTVEPFLVRGFELSNLAGNNKDYHLAFTPATTVQEIRDFTKDGVATIRYGVHDPKLYADEKGSVRALCGELTLQIRSAGVVSADQLLQVYITLLPLLWDSPPIVAFGERMARAHIPVDQVGTTASACDVALPGALAGGNDYNSLWVSQCDEFPAPEYYLETRDSYQAIVNAAVDNARSVQAASNSFVMTNKILQRGWAGAGIWYSKLAEINGAFVDGVGNIPRDSLLPYVIEKVRAEKVKTNQDVPAESRNSPNDMGGDDPYDSLGGDKIIAKALDEVLSYFQKNAAFGAAVNEEGGSVFVKLMNSFFGTQGLFDMRKNTDVHPLVQLTALGKSIIDQGIVNLMRATGIEFVAGVASQIDGFKAMGKNLATLSDVWFSIVLMSLGFGFLMYYVIPFFPFIYFFFAVVKWVQSVFEAMIGMPLWALAHLRIDGDGIPGDAAKDGYVLILEVALRPILTIFGLIASFMIFTAMAYTLNDLFDLLVLNTTGFDPNAANGPASGQPFNGIEYMRSGADAFFVTIMYVILMYLIATSCFKLIDRIPAEVLRWMGSDVKNIIDMAGDETPGMVRNMLIQAFGMPVVQKSEEGMLGRAVEGIQGAVRESGELAGETLNAALKKGGKKPQTLADLMKQLGK